MASKTRIGENNPMRGLRAHVQEAIKMHHTYDGSSRLSIVYTALEIADHGDTCIKTSYTYDGTSNRVVGMKEELATWDSAWDI